jgi:hypothetical protein
MDAGACAGMEREVVIVLPLVHVGGRARPVLPEIPRPAGESAGLRDDACEKADGWQ